MVKIHTMLLSCNLTLPVYILLTAQYWYCTYRAQLLRHQILKLITVERFWVLLCSEHLSCFFSQKHKSKDQRGKYATAEKDTKCVILLFFLICMWMDIHFFFFYYSGKVSVKKMFKNHSPLPHNIKKEIHCCCESGSTTRSRSGAGRIIFMRRTQ